jgi:hypothetical protein
MLVRFDGRTLSQSDCITVASTDQLRDAAYQAGLRLAAARTGIGRRCWPAHIHIALHEYRGEIRWPGGARFPVPDLHTTFPEVDQRWLGSFLAAPTPGRPLRLQERVIERIRLIDLYLRLRHPEWLLGYLIKPPVNDNNRMRWRRPD